MNISSVGTCSNPYNINIGKSLGEAMMVQLFSELLDNTYQRVHDKAEVNIYNSVTYNINNVNITYGSDGKNEKGPEGVGNNINTRV